VVRQIEWRRGVIYEEIAYCCGFQKPALPKEAERYKMER
jgi:hypothetical protein